MGTKFVTGFAKGDSSHDVGKEAAKMAFQKLGDDKVHLSIVFASPKYDYQEVLRGVREITDNAPLFGCSSAGEFTEEGIQHESVVCALITSDTHKFFTGIGEGLREDAMKSICDASKKFPASIENYPYRSYILCEDGLTGKAEETPLAMLSILGANMKFVGGCAGDDLKMKETKVFADNKVLADAISLAFIASKKPLAISLQHGHKAISPPLTITKSEANIVYEIDGKPAFEIWKKYAGADAKNTLGIDINELQEDDKNVSRFLTYYEAGLYVTEKEEKIRWPGATTTVTGPLKFNGVMPEGAVLRVMSSSKESQVESTRDAAESIINSLRGEKLVGVLVFDCVVRGLILQDEFSKAIDAMKELLKVPIIGFETYGEFAMEIGQPMGYHNATTVILGILD
ncbi:MAG: FIST C-terminal domain-containing protein [Gammaproteobacteria bacterium]|nr:FIST C-terminal domain-containing protein [Gammaproteobacteria bacterium]